MAAYTAIRHSPPPPPAICTPAWLVDAFDAVIYADKQGAGSIRPADVWLWQFRQEGGVLDPASHQGALSMAGQNFPTARCRISCRVFHRGRVQQSACGPTWAYMICVWQEKCSLVVPSTWHGWAGSSVLSSSHGCEIAWIGTGMQSMGCALTARGPCSGLACT